MTEPGAFFLATTFVVGFLVGLRSTVRLTARYKTVAPSLMPREGLILQAFVVVSGSITIAAGFFGALAVRRLLGFDPLTWSAPLTVLLSAIVLFLPLYLERVVDRVARKR